MARCLPTLEKLVNRLRTKLLVGALAAALPLVAVAGCGAEKRRTIKAELSSAGDSLQTSSSMSVTLRVKDDAGNLVKAATEGDAPKGLAQALIGGSVSYTIDPAGKQTLADLSFKDLSESELKDALKQVNVALVVRSDKADIGELRLVDGTLYAHVDLQEVNRLVVLGGGDPIDASLDETFGDDPQLAKGLADVRAGKWIKLPISDYIEKLTDLAKSFSGSEEPAPAATATPNYNALSDRLFKAVKPYIKVTDASDSSGERVLDVKVQVRPALKAGLAVLQATEGLPFTDQLRDVQPTEIDKNVKDGTINGTITLKNSHFTQFTLDLESVRTLDPEDTGPSLKGGHVVFDVNDSAAEVTAPTDLSSFDIGELLDGFLSDLEGEQAA